MFKGIVEARKKLIKEISWNCIYIHWNVKDLNLKTFVQLVELYLKTELAAKEKSYKSIFKGYSGFPYLNPIKGHEYQTIQEKADYESSLKWQ